MFHTTDIICFKDGWLKSGQVSNFVCIFRLQKKTNQIIYLKNLRVKQTLVLMSYPKIMNNKLSFLNYI